MSIKPRYRFINNLFTLALPNVAIIQELTLLNHSIILPTF